MIGQVVYNIRDYNSSGGYISTVSGGDTTVSSTDANYESKRLNIFTTDIAKLYTTTSGLTKVGVQAPSGTQVILNGTKTIMIGRTGVYELDEDINITSMYFVRPYNYTLDTVATATALALGQKGLADAEEGRKTALAALDAEYGSDKGAAYWGKYAEIQEEFQEAYGEAYGSYLTGINGVYSLPNPGNLNDDSNYSELYGVIVDFRY